MLVPAPAFAKELLQRCGALAGPSLPPAEGAAPGEIQSSSPQREAAGLREMGAGRLLAVVDGVLGVHFCALLCLDGQCAIGGQESREVEC